MNVTNLPYAYLLDTGNASERIVVSERRNSVCVDVVGVFASLLGSKGNVFFSDYQGIIGVNSLEFGLSLCTEAGNSDGTIVSNHAISTDGELYVAIILNGGSQIVGMREEGFVWKCTIDSILHLIDISEDGEIVVVDGGMDGIIVLDGITGEIIDRYLRGKQISSLQVSENGNFIAVVMRDNPQTPGTSTAKSIVLIDRSKQSEIVVDQFDTSSFGRAIFVHQITDSGIILLEDAYNPNDETQKLFLINPHGEVLWSSEDISGPCRIDNGTFTRSATIASVEQTDNGILVAYFNRATRELIILKLINALAY